MLPLRRIICPTDFSDPSHEALETAQELARHFAAELVLVHVVDLVPALPASAVLSPQGTGWSLFNVKAYQEAMQHGAEQQLEQVAKERIAGDVKLRWTIVAGTPAKMIVELADSEQADLIVIATHGRTGVKRLVFGSVAEKVVRTADCPVLTIQSKEDDRE